MRNLRTSLISLSTAALVVGTAALATQNPPQRPTGTPGERADAPKRPADRDGTQSRDRAEAMNRMGQIDGSNDHSPRHSALLASRLTQMDGSLSEAIDAAEKHSGGVAIGIRLAMLDSDMQRSGNAGAQDGNRAMPRTPGQTDRGQTGRPTDRQNDGGQTGRPTDRQTDGSQTGRDADRGQTGRDADRGQTGRMGDDGRPTRAPSSTGPDARSATGGSLCAIITCVVDRTRVRDVIVDLDDNSIVGLQSSMASRERRVGSPSHSDDRSSGTADRTGRSMVRASDLMNATVRNSSGDRVGDIDDLAIDPESNRVVYGVLHRGGFLGMGESRYAIACSELSVPRDGELRLDLSDDDFKGHSGFERNDWPTRADSRWSSGGTPDPSAAPTASRVVKASDIIGSDVMCRDGRKLGEVDDLVVDAQHGRVVFAIIDTDDGSLIVPMAAFQRKENTFVLPMAQSDIRSKEMFDSAREPNWNDQAWGRRVHESYGVRAVDDGRGTDPTTQPGSQPGSGRGTTR